jgi:S1-C subfamily serine protease
MGNANRKIRIATEEVMPQAADRIVVVDLSPTPAASTSGVPSPKKRTTMALPLLFAFLLFVLAGVSAYSLWPKRNWITRIDAMAGNSIVRIETSDGSMGSGFVIASRGNRHLILTNRHVLRVANGLLSAESTTPGTCRIVLRSGFVVAGHLAGVPADQDVDLALLVAESDALRPLAPVKLFEKVQIGDNVVAVGHPLGLDFSITQGIVSAKREGMLVQTSAAINQGNSGGPLMDQEGYVIGVNTMTIRPTEGQSLGFAIRADVILDRMAWTYAKSVSDLVEQIGQ